MEEFSHNNTWYRLYPVSLRGAGIALVLYIIATALVYGFYLRPPLWDKNFGVADNRHFFGPNTFYLDSSLKNGEFPLWNPLAYCGLPFSADGQTSSCYPFHLLRSVLTPAFDPYASAAGMQLLLVLHVIWAGLGAFFLAQSYGLSVGAATVSGLAFMFSPYSMIYFTDYYVYAMTLTWAAWILWAVRRTLYAGNRLQRLWNGTWAVMFFSISTLGGFPQLSLYTGIMVALFVVLDTVLHFPCSVRLRDIRNAFRALGLRIFFLSLLAVSVAIASAVLLLPEMEMGWLGARTIAGGLNMPNWPQNLEPFHLIKCLVVFPGNTWGPEGCRAAGIGSLLAVIAALSHRRRRDVLVFLALYLLMTDCTLGPPYPLGGLLRKLDFMNITVSPWRAGDFSILALGLVAGFGIDAAGRMPRTVWRRLLRTVVLFVAALGISFVAYHWLSNVPRLLFTPSIVVWVLPAITCVLLVVFTWWNAPRLGRIAVAILVGCEMVAWGAQVLPNAVNRHHIADNPDTVGFGQENHLTRSNYRYAHLRPNRQMWFLDHAVNGYNPLFLGATSQVLCSPADDRGYFRRIHLRYKAVTEDNLHGTLLAKRCFWLARQWVSGNLPPKNEAFPPTTTVFLPEVSPGTHLPVAEVAPDRVPKIPVSESTVHEDLGNGETLSGRVMQQGAKRTLQFPDIQPHFMHTALCIRYQATARKVVSASCMDETGAYRGLKSNEALITSGEANTFYVPLPDCETCAVTLAWPGTSDREFQPIEAYLLKDTADENAHIFINNRTPNTVEVTLKDLPESRMLVFVDSWYPGWHARLDGNEVPILKANDAFKAIMVPAGTHDVTFAFRPALFYIGLIASFAAFSGFIGLLVGTVIMSHKKRMPFRIVEESQLPTMQNETPLEQPVHRDQSPALKHRKLFLLTLVLLVIGVAVLIGAVVTEKPQSALFGGSQNDNEGLSVKKPIEISTIRALHDIGLKPDLPLDGVYLMSGDIDASDTSSWYGGAGFRPVGSEERPFAGQFDGQGFCIRNLVINRPDVDGIGLFGVVDTNATVTGVQLVNAKVTGYFNVGSLAGTNRGTVSKCGAYGTVTGEAYLGGLVGGNAGSTRQCYALVSVAGESRLGSLVGMNTGRIEECFGGGKLTGKSYVGGLIGRNQGGTVAASFWDITSTGAKTSESGTGQETAVLMTRRPYVDAGWDFTSTWEIAEGASYPQFMNRSAVEVTSMPSAIEIISIEQLQRIGREESLPLGGNYTLPADLDAQATATWDEGRGFAPVGAVAGGKPAMPFTGRLDGRGHVIRGLVIMRPESNDAGLFAVLGKDAQVMTLGLPDISITGNGNVGGLCGQNFGAVGSCFMQGTVKGYAYVGGLVGIQNGNVDKCYSLGTVSGDSRVGGLAGMNQGSVSECFAAVAITGNSLTGGLVGRNYRGGTVAENCFWDRTVCSLNVPGDSTGRPTAEMFRQATYAAKAWDFSQVWTIAEGRSYPALRVFPQQ